MSKIKEKLENMLKNQKQEKETVDEGFVPTARADVLPVIRELAKTNWSKGKKMQMEACKKLMRIAESNENVSNIFMRGMDKASTQIGEKLIERINNNFFKVQKPKK